MKLLIIGHARHGKDTVADLLNQLYGLRFVSSSYFAADKVIRPALAACDVVYDTLEECYADRMNHRAFWYEAIKAYNRGGSSRLAEAILVDHDMYVGMRSAAEYQASKHMFDKVLWVDARGRGLPPEPLSSMDIEFNPEEMLLVENNGTLADLAETLQNLL